MFTKENNPHTLGTLDQTRKTPRDVAKHARQYTIEAIENAAYIMRNAAKDSDKMKAIEFLVERGHGKAPLKIELTKGDLDDSKKSEFQLLFESAAERAHKALHAIPELPAPPLDITPPCEQAKSQLRDKTQLALETANAAGITIVESREESAPLPHEIK